MEVGPSNPVGQQFCQYKIYVYSIGFHVVLLLIMVIIHLLHSELQLPCSLLIPGAGAAGLITQVSQAGRLQ